ncbi:universal stress protein [uncultured Winogradskyella sp.]|uniref:universal stress protein n=1 Tax=uncultured Winogradskyella sp. TaxID=395353 RepID=UPI00260BD301|nr:universal stress protein [uncultured Winogradskyella sp.]
MKDRKYKILVLSDLKESTQVTLKNTIGLAKMINGSIEFFHVTKPTDIVNSDSQLSAKRNINRQFIATDKKIKQLLDPVLLDYDINIKHKYAIGNVKSEIEKRINALKPDIVVLGKRKPKVLNFIGDNVTDYILKHYKGAVMIASKDNIIDFDSQLSIGALNDFEEAFNKDLTKSLIDSTEVPLKAFKIGNSNTNKIKTTDNEKNIIEYVFKDSPGVVGTLSGYISKNNINLLYLDRQTKHTKEAYTKDLIDKVEVSLLVT